MNHLKERFNLNPNKTFTDEPVGFKFDDGGRKAAGYKGDADDCVTRALAIVLIQTGRMNNPAKAYQSIYDEIFQMQKECYKRKRKTRRKTAPSPREGTYKKVTKEILQKYGGEWKATMQIGSGCQVHLRANELPSGIIVASVSKHITTMIDGCVYDTHNPARGGTRCVYGYWKFNRS